MDELSALDRYYQHVAAQPCLACGSHGVEVAHVRAFRSRKTGDLLPRRKGIAKFAAIPLCPDCHRHSPNSIHNIGEANFFGRLDQPCRVFALMAQLIAETFGEEA